MFTVLIFELCRPIYNIKVNLISTFLFCMDPHAGLIIMSSVHEKEWQPCAVGEQVSTLSRKTMLFPVVLH